MPRRICILVVCGVLAFIADVGSGAPGILNYSGRLTDSSGQPLTGVQPLTFTFWDAQTGGSLLGSYVDTKFATPDGNGVVSVNIGDAPGSPIPISILASEQVWLNVNVAGANVTPRLRIMSTGFALNALPLYGPAFAAAQVSTDTLANGQNLIAAYARAKALTPHGQPLSATNRAAVLVLPGQYNLGAGQLMLDAEFVDVIGLSSARDDQYVFGTSNGPNTGVLAQSANDVHIENLSVECTRASGILIHDSSGPAAYFPGSGMTGVVMRNCAFKANGVNAFSMRIGVDYAGDYQRVTGGVMAFGYSGAASGTFTDCVAGMDSFGSYGAASGTFTNCVGGDFSFGSVGTASGTFTNCQGGADSFGSSATANGFFFGCTGGDYSFGGYILASGTFTNCTGGHGAFAGGGNASGVFTNCVGGDYSFGGHILATSSATGRFTHCMGGSHAFGNGSDATGGVFLYCRGGLNSFTLTGSPTVRYCVLGNAAYP